MKEINLSRNGIFSKLYQFVYRTSLPMGLCNFFWANLIALVFVIPFVIWTLPVIIVEFITERKNKETFIEKWSRQHDGEFWNLIGFSLLAWFLILIVYLYGYGIYWMITMCQYFVKPTTAFWIINAIALIIGIPYFWDNVINPWWKRWNKERDLKRAEAWYLSLDRGELYENYEKEWLLDDYYRRNRYEDKEPITWWITIVWTAIVSFYDKNCPVINWK